MKTVIQSINIIQASLCAFQIFNTGCAFQLFIFMNVLRAEDLVCQEITKKSITFIRLSFVMSVCFVCLVYYLL